LLVVEFVSPEFAAHHVGAPTGRTCQRSVGIEVCYPGPAPAGHRGSYDAAAAWFAALGWREMHPVKLPCPDGAKRWFAAIPDAVYGALIELCTGICRAYPIRSVCNHHQFSPQHRIDPDPPISLDLLRSRLRDETGREFLARPPRR
jgi:N-acetyl-anhydromuramyl-L-alanine amidase AmpD